MQNPMQIDIVIPHYGDDEQLFRLYSTLEPGEFLLTESISQYLNEWNTDYGGLFIVNNNIENKGFTEACNIGIEAAMSNGADAIWLLNNDTEVENIENALKAIEDEFSTHTDTGVIGCCIVSLDDPDFIHHGGTGRCFPAGVHKVGRRSLSQLDKRTRERWVTGASMVVSRGLVEAIGRLDKNFVNYGSDSDYCLRARIAGFDVVYRPDIVVRHKIGQSAHPSPEQEKVLRSDMLKFADKWVTAKLFSDLENETF